MAVSGRACHYYHYKPDSRVYFRKVRDAVKRLDSSILLHKDINTPMG